MPIQLRPTPTVRGVAVVVSVVVAAGLWFYAGTGNRSPGQVAPLVSPTAMSLPHIPSEAGGTITVHVSGAVLSPGVVAVDQEARVADAVSAAGGATVQADLSLLNLAAVLRDGEQVVVPVVGAPPRTQGAGLGDGGPVHLNTAAAVDLLLLPGVGPVLAQRILDHREENGPFAIVEDLLDVPGIGEGKLAALRDAVAVP